MNVVCTKPGRVTVVHRPECPYAEGGGEWIWARDKDYAEVKKCAAMLRYQLCTCLRR